MDESGKTRKRQWKLPRGYENTKSRLTRAIKRGATMKELGHASVVRRVLNGEPVRRDSLKQLNGSISTWEAKQPVRVRATRVLRQSPVRKAAGVAVAPSFSGATALEVIEAFIALDTVGQARVMSVLLKVTNRVS